MVARDIISPEYLEVPSLTVCKELKKLGFPQDEFFINGVYWYVREKDSDEYYLWNSCEISEFQTADFIDVVRAPTIREMDEWIFRVIEYMGIFKYEDDVFCYAIKLKDSPLPNLYTWHGIKEADIKAQILIWLVKEKRLKFIVNERR